MNSSDVSISQRPNLLYPADCSPDTCYPEYPFTSDLISHENGVYALVRQCFYESGVDRENFGTPHWNPLGQWVKPGNRVLILPNLVAHRRPGESLEAFQSKCTHASVIRAVLDYAIIATGAPSLISVGNASLQSCDYEQVRDETGLTSVAQFYRKHMGVEIGPFDLRLLVSRWTRYGALLERREGDPAQAVSIDLGEHSLLDELFRHMSSPPQIRVGDYAPGETMSYHGAGRHVYVVNRRVLDSDVIISVPKLKTHQKVGITCALKGTVGAIARKECLAHHRRGSPENGGDEFPHSDTVRNIASMLSDRAAAGGNSLASNVVRVCSKVLSKILRLGNRGIMGGAWYGNDTAWRMALDIARVLRYARSDGSLSPTPLRQHLALVDGIIAGEGEGPLTPSPRSIGAILFGADICAVDVVCALAMGFDPVRLPIVRNSFLNMPFPLTDKQLVELNVTVNGILLNLPSFPKSTEPFIAPKGWRGMIELPK